MKYNYGKYGSIFEMFLLVVSIMAFAFLISPSEKTIAKAQENVVCCEKTVDGAWCQQMPQEKCDKAFSSSPTSCESTSFCKMGCCYDSSEGICMENTPQKICEQGNGTWKDSATCDVPQCQLGCCVLGIQAAFVTLTRCKQLSSFYNLETDFRKNIGDELTCLTIASLSDEGACVFEADYARTCKFTTRQECNKLGQGTQERNATVTGNTTFYKDYLCSSEELATNCGPTTRTACKEGRDEVYFLDSCGNPANIYDSGKVNDKAYWSKIVKKEESCGYGNTNGNSNSKTCGNCDYFYGSMCKTADRTNRATYGDYICKNLNCKTAQGATKKNGESWCYTDKPGGKTDTAGSRYFRHICINGEEIIEPCADFRQEICLESKIGEFSQAGCVINRWQDCIMQNFKEDCENADKRDCEWISTEKSVPVNTTAACAPKYSPGLEFWNDEASKSVCSYGRAVCKWKEVKSQETGWSWEVSEKEHPCVLNTDGDLKPNWVEEQKAKCADMGDCALQNYGGKFNFIGKAGYARPATIAIVETFFLPLLKPIVMLIVKIVGEENVVEAVSTAPNPTGGSWFRKIWDRILGKTAKPEAAKAPAAAPTTSPAKPEAAGKGWGGFRANNPGTATFAEGIMWGFMAYGVAKMIGGLVAPDEEALVESISQAIGVGVMAYRWMLGTKYIPTVKGSTWGMSSGAAAGWALLIAVAYFYFTYKEDRSKITTIECLPYEPPVKGGDCEKCNSDVYPCTEYRCKSLGQACQLLNKGTTQEKCAWVNPGDVTSPIIRPNENVLTSGYKYIGEGVRPPGRGFEIQRAEGGKCIKAFTPITFGISTDEPTQCKIEYNHTASFANMTFFVGGSNNFKYNHTQFLSLPGPSNINSQGVVIQNNGEYEFFIRCQDANGNENVDEYVVKFCVEKGPDVTPPVIIGTSIMNNMPIKYNSNSTYLEVYVNEPAECKWSRLDQSYDGMENTFSCDTKLEQVNSQMLYTCKTTLTGLNNNQDNVYYFKCKDQPTGIDPKDRNVNQDSFKFTLKGTKPLDIVKVGPNGTASGSTTLVPVYLEVETDNGYNYGDAVCSYSLTPDDKDFIKMFETGTNKHKQRQDLPTGSYSYYFKCTDLGGNTDYATITFSVYVDQQAPEVIRIYNYEDKLTIRTDENSDCSYSLNDELGCNFKIDEGVNMPYAKTTEHATEWQVGKTFYIKCRDESGNEPLPTECSARIKTTKS
jgi:hypothetical protein